MSLFKREKRGMLPLPIVPPFPGTGIYGQPLASNPDTALQTSAVWACSRLLSDIVAMLPVDAVRNSVVMPNLPQLLQNPASDTTLPDWLYMLMMSSLMRGNTYGIVAAVDGNGYPTQIELQDPDKVQVTINRTTGKLDFRILGRPIPAWQNGIGGVGSLWHFKAFRYPGNPLGLSPITYAARCIGIELGASKFAGDFFRSNGHPVGVMESDQLIDQTQARTIKERFLSAVRNREPAVLGSGLKYQTLSITAEESQFLNTQQATATQIARYFGVPPEMIAAPSGNSMTYSNVEQRAQDLLTFGVQPWLNRIEYALFPLLPQAQSIRFDVSGFLRADVDTRYKTYAIGIAAKFLTPDDARDREGLPALTAAQKAELDLVPLTVTPTGGPKALPVPPAGGGAPPSGGGDDGSSE